MSQLINWTRQELIVLASLYVVFMLLSATVTLLASGKAYQVSADLLVSFPWHIVYLAYPLKALCFLPIYYLNFRILPEHKFWLTVIQNLALLPVWLGVWSITYYWSTDYFQIRWSLYDPEEEWVKLLATLFYTFQFSLIYAHRYFMNLHHIDVKRFENERMTLQNGLYLIKPQLSSHFLHNALTTIAASMSPIQERTHDMIMNLSKIFLYHYKNKPTVLRLQEELDAVNSYLLLERERYGERLEFQIAVSSPLKSALVPPMLLQPLVENAVQHGIIPQIKGGEVMIVASALNGRLTLSVEDNGIGFIPKEITDGGLNRVHCRLNLLSDSNLEVVSFPGKGTQCRISLPLVYAPNNSMATVMNSDPSPEKRYHL